MLVLLKEKGGNVGRIWVWVSTTNYEKITRIIQDVYAVLC